MLWSPSYPFSVDEKRDGEYQKKLVAKIMTRDKLVCITQSKRHYNSYRGTISRIADNVLKRQFSTENPNQK